jgi:C1A family cysteine protease
MRSFTILLAIAIISLSNGATIFQEIQWNDFKLKFQKSFRSFSDETIRKQNFLKNLKTIERHNAKYEQGLSTYYMGVNFYSDWTWEEFEKTLLNENVEGQEPITQNKYSKSNSEEAPDSVDWKHIMTPVKNQGHCGSCWSFSAVGTVEAAWFKAGNPQVVLAEQEVIDCGMGDCDGGWKWAAYDTIIDMGGIMAEDDYHYTANDTVPGQCMYDSELKSASITSYDQVDNDIDTIMEAMASKGPLAMSLYVNDNWRNYAGGIFEDETCPQTKSNHAIIGVGYDKIEGFWTIRNSWSTSWGEAGHIRMKMGVNTCAVEYRPVFYPVV